MVRGDGSIQDSAAAGGRRGALREGLGMGQVTAPHGENSMALPQRLATLERGEAEGAL